MAQTHCESFYQRVDCTGKKAPVSPADRDELKSGNGLLDMQFQGPDMAPGRSTENVSYTKQGTYSSGVSHSQIHCLWDSWVPFLLALGEVPVLLALSQERQSA
jgi:hypothetical protein